MQVTKITQEQLEEILSLEADFNEDYLCPIGRNIMSDPVKLNCCQHIFDRIHIQTWMDKNSTCPFDKKQIVMIESDEILRVKIDNYVKEKLQEKNLVLGEEHSIRVEIDSEVRSLGLALFEKSYKLQEGILSLIDPNIIKVRQIIEFGIPNIEYTGEFIDNICKAQGNGSSGSWRVQLRNDGYQGGSITRIY